MRQNVFYEYRWQRAVALARSRGLLKKPRCSDLRHTRVAWLIAGGTPLPKIQQRLGHESIQTTIDVCGGLLADTDDQVDAVVDAAFAALAAESPRPAPARCPLDPRRSAATRRRCSDGRQPPGKHPGNRPARPFDPNATGGGHDRMYSIDEAAELLSVPATWLRGKVTARAVPHTRLAGTCGSPRRTWPQSSPRASAGALQSVRPVPSQTGRLRCRTTR